MIVVFVAMRVEQANKEESKQASKQANEQKKPTASAMGVQFVYPSAFANNRKKPNNYEQHAAQSRTNPAAA